MKNIGRHTSTQIQEQNLTKKTKQNDEHEFMGARSTKWRQSDRLYCEKNVRIIEEDYWSADNNRVKW